MSMKRIKRLSHTMSDLMRSSTILFDLSRVVEELVHNSVDAGSTKVVISLSIRACYVKVEDDGCGIARDGLVILGERYATSKVHLVADATTSTETLGVRGEALSSLSDISLLEIRSKVRGNPNAYCKIIKSSKCLFFGIDDQREDVGTTVIVRDLFYNQPIRRKFMQSSVRKVLHSVKKCVFRIALVHPKVSFKVIDLEGEEKLLCTIPSTSSLPLLMDGFGNEVSSLLREIVYSDRVLALSGYISGPTDAFLKKAFQYIYINSRFVCKGPIHNLINGLATSFQSTIAKWRDNSENYCRKRQKAKGYPAYFLNLCCPMSSYDLSFEPSKTVVEFKDWGTILSFFEKAIMTFWKQLATHLLQGETTVCKPSFHESGTSGKEISEIKTMKNRVLFHQDSTSCSRITNPLDTSSGDGNNYQKHNHSCDDQAVSFSQHKRCQSKDNLVDTADCFFKHDVKSLHGTTNYVRSRYMNSKSFGINDFSPCLSKDNFSSDCILGEMLHENYPTRSKFLKEESKQSSGTFEPHGIGGDICHFPVGCDSDPSKTYMEKSWFMENEEVTAASCSTSYYPFGDNLDFLKELFSDDRECTTGVNQYNKCLNVSNNFISTKNTTIGLLQGRIYSDRHVNGFIRKCQTSKAENAPLSCTSSPFFHDRACLTEQTSLCHGKVTEPLEADSKSGSSWNFAYPGQLLARTPPQVQDFMHDSTMLDNHVCSTVAGYRHYAIEEKNAEFLDAVLNDCSEVLPDVNCTQNTILDHRFCPSYSNYLQCDYHSDELMPAKDSSTVLLNEEKSYLRSESSSPRHAEIYDNTFLNLAKQNNDDAVEMSSKNKKFKNSLPSDVQKSRLQRSHSAPPFYKGKKKFPILNCLPTDYARDSSTMNSSQEPHGPLEPYSASQPYIKPITELSQPCSREFIYEKSNQSIMIELQSCEKFGPVLDELDLASASLTKWRTGSLRPPFLHDIDMPHNSLENNGDVLDISSGLLHLAGSSLVPESINKECLDDAKVLLQLDRKFIPVVASGTLVIIDQHAADERIRLEELRKKVLNGELSSITHLNTEHELILPEMWYQMLQKYAEQIKKWGWICNFHSQCLEPFARNMNFLRQHKCRATLVAVPHILGINLTDKDLLEYIEQLVETDGSSIIPPSVIRILNFKACRGAIMFGDALLPSECSLIVEELKATSLCFQCAHGRPTTVPLLNMASLHQQLARLDMLMSGQQQHEWHGLRRHMPSIQRAQHRLELSKRLLHG